MKGDWLLGLALRVLRRSVGMGEAARFIAARFARKPTSFSVEGVRFVNADHILWSLAADVFFRRVYSPRGMEIEPDDIVVDVGAHKGVFSAYAARRTRAVVLACEPDPANCLMLNDLLSINGMNNVECRQVALAGVVGHGMLYLAESSSRNSITGFDQRSGARLQRAIEVNTITLDELLLGLERVAFVKIDCEGAELPILMAASDQTLAKIERMAVETHFGPASPEIEQLLARLRSRFACVVTKQQPGQRLGYLYAWRDTPTRSRVRWRD